MKLADLGGEYGVTTGRRRKVNWLNLNMLISAINLSGTTNLVVSKCDVIDELGKFKLFYNDELVWFNNLHDMCNFITANVTASCEMISEIRYSSSPREI